MPNSGFYANRAVVFNRTVLVKRCWANEDITTVEATTISYCVHGRMVLATKTAGDTLWVCISTENEEELWGESSVDLVCDVCTSD